MKAQMELMGIAIVAVLMSLILVFVVKFVILDPPELPGTDFQESEQAANFLNTMLKTNALDCSDVSFSTLIQDCAKNYPDGAIKCVDNVFSCGYLREALGGTDGLFDKTLVEWSGGEENYYFIVYGDPESPEDTKLDDLTFPIGGGMCQGDRRVKIQPLPVPPDTIFVALYMCS